MKKVTVYSRSGCHLCEIAIDRIKSTMDELKFELDIKLIDNDVKLQEEYGEQVPVILIEGKVHDYWRVDLERFTKAVKA
ncbi:MAG: glutaredoxin family protein [Actinobacteria bacterium]|jgi:glutaredoxin|nr:glutaredoxin family protein [Actinomycetota bacterium]